MGPWLRIIAVGLCALSVGGGTEVRILGGGASFPKAIYQRWAADWGGRAGGGTGGVEYTSQGSGFGVAGIMNRTLDFAGSDAPLSKGELVRAGGPGAVVQVPSVAGAVVMAVNLPGLAGGGGDNHVQLTGGLIADIYLGVVSRWDDPAVAACNPELKLPSLAITPVYRADASGTTYVFTSYLGTQSEAFVKMSAPGKTIHVPGGQAGKGSEGVSNVVRKIPGALGYVELKYALDEKLTVAAVRNRAGHYVVATAGSVSSAGAAATSLTAKIWDAPGEGDYPISAFTYLLVYRDLTYLGDRAKAQAVAGFLAYCAGDGQDTAAGLGYAPLPPAMRGKVREALGGIEYEGRSVLGEGP